MGSRDLTDGIWVWPEGLAHYVDIHSVGLPEEFTKHALSVPDATMPEESQPYDDGYWIRWCAARRVQAIRGGLLEALAETDAEELIPKAQRIEALEHERGTSNEKCLWVRCTRASLVGSKVCAEHYVEHPAVNRHRALRAYLGTLPASMRKV